MEFLKYKEFVLESVNSTEIDDIIIQWIDQKTSPSKLNNISNYLLSKKKDIQELAKINPEKYLSPVNQTCYRGLEKVSDKNFVIDSIKRKKFELTKAPGYEGYIDALKIQNYPYIPSRNSQSWSIDPDVAWRFSESGLILETIIDDNFIMNPEYTSSINKKINRSGASSGLSEEEVIHLGKQYKNVFLYIDINSIEEDDILYPYVKEFQ